MEFRAIVSHLIQNIHPPEKYKKKKVNENGVPVKKVSFTRSINYTIPSIQTVFLCPRNNRSSYFFI